MELKGGKEIINIWKIWDIWGWPSYDKVKYQCKLWYKGVVVFNWYTISTNIVHAAFLRLRFKIIQN